MQTEAARSVFNRAERLVFLSGTPSVNKPFDLFNQVSMLRPDIFPKDRIDFAKLYCNHKLVPRFNFNPNNFNQRNGRGGGGGGRGFGRGGGGGGFGGIGGQRFYGNNNNNSNNSYSSDNIPMRNDNSGLSRAAELHLVLKQEVMIRRLKIEVLDQLPPKRRQVVRLPKPPAKDWPLVPGMTRHKADDSDASSDEENSSFASSPKKEIRRNSGGGRGAHGVGPSLVDRKTGGTGGAGVDGEGVGDGTSTGAGIISMATTTNAVPSILATATNDGDASDIKRMSAAHRTGVAKCRLVTEWIIEQLGIEDRGESREEEEEEAEDGDGLLDGTTGDGSTNGDPQNVSNMTTKFIVFAHHKSVMNHLFEKLGHALAAPVGRSGRNSGRKYEVLRIDGETIAEERRTVERRFRSDPNVKVALLSVSATSEGVDFSSASAVVFAG